MSAAGVGIVANVALTNAGTGADVPEFVLPGRVMKRCLLPVLFGRVFVVALAGELLARAVDA